MSFTSKKGSYCTNSCGRSATYREPTMEFDRYADDGKSTSKTYSVNGIRSSMSFFSRDGDTINPFLLTPG
jgi:hypothetical protein